MSREKRKEDRGLRWAVDIPPFYWEANEWQNVGFFPTKKAAIAFVQGAYGADNKGRVNLISELPEEE